MGLSGKARELLGPRGPFAAMPGYEAREGQLDMAEAVERALDDASVLLVEAGTGTGKTLAYLVPAILSGQRIVISTATKALEEQLMEKDVPLALSALGVRPKVALVKGLSNYLCLRRLGEMRASASAWSAPEIRRSLPLVDAWAKETETGDFAELSAVGEGDPILGEVSSSSDTRIGSACEHFDRCFVTRMKREAEDARILIVNHHLFFADLALKASAAEDGAGSSRGAEGVLGRFDAVVFDEAHRLEEIASEFFGVRISSSKIGAMARDAERTFAAHGLADRLFVREDGLSLVADVKRAAEELFRAAARAGARAAEDARREAATAAKGEGRVPLEPGSWSGPLHDAWIGLDAALDVLGGFAEANATSDAVDVVRRRAEKIRNEVARVAEPRTGSVAWVESAAKSTSIGVSYVDVGPFLRDNVFKKLGGVVLTSATLTSTDVARPAATRADPEEAPRPLPAPKKAPSSFAFLRARLGLDDELDVPVEELGVESPFDHATRTLLYLPHDLPEVNEQGFLERAAERTRELIDAAGGGAFVLCTSLRSMTSIASALRARGAKAVMTQGEAPKTRLLARFREHGHASLVATMSFWEGVDVPGDALRLVVIDKIPFAVPSDPVVAARSRGMEERGRNPFVEYAVPEAAITLKQGFGRLIRTAEDRGVVAVLDRRLSKKAYGARILATLPAAKRTSHLDDVRAFFRLGSAGAKPV